jgi:hypothetical protein
LAEEYCVAHKLEQAKSKTSAVLQHEDYSLNYVTSARFVRRHARTALLSLALCTAGGAWVSAQSQDSNTSAVRLPQDIVYKGSPERRNTLRCLAIHPSLGCMLIA